jgi:YHS domain-containing protein
MISRIVVSAVFVGAILAGGWLLSGCEKKQPAPPAKPVTQTMSTQQTATKAAEPAKDTAATATVEQTTCPVMGSPIDKNIFVEYKGKKVYFCCKMCPPEFEKNPEKYISKLPQFK